MAAQLLSRGADNAAWRAEIVSGIVDDTIANAVGTGMGEANDKLASVQAVV